MLSRDGCGAAHVESHAPLDQSGDERRVQRDVALRGHRFEARAVAALELDRIALGHDCLDLVGLHVAEKV